MEPERLLGPRAKGASTMDGALPGDGRSLIPRAKGVDKGDKSEEDRVLAWLYLLGPPVTHVTWSLRIE
jgi:hypothetical protein